MENILGVNTRILIGQELGEVYLIIQQFINNKWQHHPNHKYRGKYFVDKKLNELLKYDICNVRKGKKTDVIKFKVAENTNVYLNDYSIIKDYPEIKKLDKRLTKKLIYQKMSNKMVTIKNQKHKIVDGNVFKVIVASTLSLGVLATVSSLKIKEDTIKLEEKISIAESTQQLNTYNINKNSQLEYNNVSELQLYGNKVMPFINNLSSVAIYEHNLTDNQVVRQKEKNNKELIIKKYAEMYYMDTLQVTNIYNENYEEIINSDNPEQTFLIKVKDTFYSDESIDKTPIISTMTSEEKEKTIIDIARNIYKIEDENNLALLLSIHRLESGCGNSRRCVEDNNPGGLKEANQFLKFKTFEIGAESFVRNVQKIINQTTVLEDYNYNNSFENNMQTIYCPGEDDWGIQVEDIKNSILENNELDRYLIENIEQNKEFIKKK